MEQGTLLSTNQDEVTLSETLQHAKQNQSTETKVKVALRVRPFISKEIVDNEQKCLQCFEQSNQVILHYVHDSSYSLILSMNEVLKYTMNCLYIVLAKSHFIRNNICINEYLSH